MESLYLAASTIFPLIVYMLVGMAIRKFKLMQPSSIKETNGMIFKTLLPLSLFNDARKASFSTVDKPWIFVFAAVCILVEFAVAWIVVSRIVKDNRDSPVLIQGVFRSNHVLFGGMVAANLCSEPGMLISASMMAMVIPLYNSLVVILFEIKRGGRVDTLKLIRNIFKNPLILGALAAYAVNFSGIQIPALVLKPIERMASAATPMALIMIGAMLTTEGLEKNSFKIGVICFVRLVFVPAIVIGLGVILGLRGDYLAVLMSVFAPPVATSTVAMSQTMGGNGELAAGLVAVTTCLSVVTIFLFVFTLSSLGFIRPV